MKLLYIKRTPQGSQVIFDDCLVAYNSIPETIINQLCVDYMSTYEGRRMAIGRKYGIKRLTPIVVNEDILMFPTHSPRTYENIWINYHEIISVTDEAVIFRGGKKLICETILVKRQLKKCYEIAF